LIRIPGNACAAATPLVAGAVEPLFTGVGVSGCTEVGADCGTVAQGLAEEVVRALDGGVAAFAQPLGGAGFQVQDAFTALTDVFGRIVFVSGDVVVVHDVGALIVVAAGMGPSDRVEEADCEHVVFFQRL